jgi:hypothetical protein
MLIGYGDTVLTFTLDASGGTSDAAAFLNDSAAMADGRSSTGTSIKFSTASATLGQYVELVCHATSAMDPTPIWGVVGVVNVQGLPEGTKLTFNGVTQRLVADEFGQLNAWWIPNGVTGSSKSIFIFNDVNGSHSIVPGATFLIGEVIVRRVISMNTLVSSTPNANLADPTTSTEAISGDFDLIRKARRTISQKLGLFTMSQAKGGAASDIADGGNPAGTVDVKTLRGYLQSRRICCVCDTPNAGRGAGTVVNGIRYSQDFMQTNFMIARVTDLGALVADSAPYWTWAPAFKESI